MVYARPFSARFALGAQNVRMRGRFGGEKLAAKNAFLGCLAVKPGFGTALGCYCSGRRRASAPPNPIALVDLPAKNRYNICKYIQSGISKRSTKRHGAMRKNKQRGACEMCSYSAQGGPPLALPTAVGNETYFFARKMEVPRTTPRSPRIIGNAAHLFAGKRETPRTDPRSPTSEEDEL